MDPVSITSSTIDITAPKPTPPKLTKSERNRRKLLKLVIPEADPKMAMVFNGRLLNRRAHGKRDRNGKRGRVGAIEIRRILKAIRREQDLKAFLASPHPRQFIPSRDHQIA